MRRMNIQKGTRHGSDELRLYNLENEEWVDAANYSLTMNSNDLLDESDFFDDSQEGIRNLYLALENEFEKAWALEEGFAFAKQAFCIDSNDITGAGTAIITKIDKNGVFSRQPYHLQEIRITTNGSGAVSDGCSAYEVFHRISKTEYFDANTGLLTTTEYGNTSTAQAIGRDTYDYGEVCGSYEDEQITVVKTGETYSQNISVNREMAGDDYTYCYDFYIYQ